MRMNRQVQRFDLIPVQLILDHAKVTGFNVGMNCGESAGQTIFHCHTPRGAGRGVIPDKMGY
jgi:hypothetical protein